MKHFKFLFDSGKFFETFALTFHQACLNADKWMQDNSFSAADITCMEEYDLPMPSNAIN